MQFGTHVRARNFFHLVCRNAAGDLKWEESFENIVVTQGLDDLLSVYFDAGSQSTSWFAGLIGFDGGAHPAPPSEILAAYTLASHGSAATTGYDEFTNYDTPRKALVFGTIAGGVIDNGTGSGGTPAVFTISGAGGVVDGAFVTDVNTGTAGILYGGNTFTERSVAALDTINLTVTLTVSST